MNQLLVIVCLGLFGLCCSSIQICNSNNNMEQEVLQRQVRNFAEIPTELLTHMDKMGTDSSLILNEYEGRYLNYIFKTDTLNFNLVGTTVGFLGSKTDFFKDERERFYHNSTPVGAVVLYLFTAEQKVESGGYDAAIVYWSKFLLPVEKVVNRLKNRPVQPDISSGCFRD